MLISLTIIGDGWGDETCEFDTERGNQKCEDKDEICLTDYRDGHEVIITCNESARYKAKTCLVTDYVIVQGPHHRGDWSGGSGIQLYHCNTTRNGWWDAHGKGVERVPSCNDTMDPNQWILGFENDGFDVYVLKNQAQDSFEGAQTKAYSFRGEVSKFLCKMNTDKKCDKRPSEVTANTSVFFCLEEDRVNVYQNKNNRWKKRDDVNVSVCTNSPSGNSWQTVGAYHDLFLFTNMADFIPAVSFDGVFKVDGTIDTDINRPGDYCLWCKDINMTPKEKEGGGYECVEESEETGDDTGGDSGGGDSSAESQVEEEICGVQCNSGRNGKSIFCAENKDDTYVYKCDSGHWSEVDVNGYCCNKNCSKPKKTNFISGGFWTTDTGHEMWFSPTARINKDAWLFNSTDVNNNCTACKEGTKYNKNSGKCEEQ